MKKCLISFFLLLLLCGGAFAQTDKTVADTRKYYNEISEKARDAEADEDKGQYGELVMNEFVINKLKHQWRAVGNHVLSYKFFYRQKEDDEKHLYPDELVLVKATKEISSRMYEQEFLYNTTGALVFYFQKAGNDDQEPSERRVYFVLGKAIRIVEDDKTRDKLNLKDTAGVKEIMADSAKIKELFNKSIKL